MSPARDQTRSALSRVKCTNHEATAPTYMFFCLPLCLPAFLPLCLLPPFPSSLCTPTFLPSFSRVPSSLPSFLPSFLPICTFFACLRPFPFICSKPHKITQGLYQQQHWKFFNYHISGSGETSSQEQSTKLCCCSPIHSWQGFIFTFPRRSHTKYTRLGFW